MRSNYEPHKRHTLQGVQAFDYQGLPVRAGELYVSRPGNELQSMHNALTVDQRSLSLLRNEELRTIFQQRRSGQHKPDGECSDMVTP